MPRYQHRRHAGFTLTEMAIVLAVVGVLAAGLWNILSGANTQMRDQAAASQQEQLISSVKSFLGSSDGEAYMTANTNCNAVAPNNCALNSTFVLPLPAACPSGAFSGMTAAEATTWCSDLPPGFTSGATNPYGQSYLIQILRDGTAAGNPPNSYSFMIMTTGVDTITDTSGARISSLIGGDGGFIYTAAVCTAAASTKAACGAYGGWSVSDVTAAGPGGFGFSAAKTASGQIASRTYVSPEQINNQWWLARVHILGDLTYLYNTMALPEYLGASPLVMGAYTGTYPYPTTPNIDSPNTIYMGNYTNTPGPELGTGGGTIELQGGVINFEYSAPVASGLGTMNVQGGTINLNTGAGTGGGTINMDAGQISGHEGSEMNMVLSGAPGVKFTSTNGYNSYVQLSTGCTADSTTHAAFPSLGYYTDAGGNPTCMPALSTTGDVSIGGYLSAYTLYSATFIYDLSGKLSDARLKKDIKPIHDALDQIDKLKPVSYRLKAGNKPDMGFLAQDVENVYPDLVLQSKDGYKAVDYEGLIAPLVNAVQELRSENEQLRHRIDDQAKEEQKFESELQALKAAK